MNLASNIDIADIFSATLNTREAATELIQIIKSSNSTEIELDFSKVDFMSRSFADQFHKEKLSFSLSYPDRTISLLNAHQEVINILNAVANTQSKKDRKNTEISVLRFTDKGLLENYLLSL